MLSGNVNIVVLLKSMHWIRWFSFAIIHGQIVFQRRPLKLTLFLLVFLAVQTRVWESSIPTPVTEWVQTYKEVLLFDIQSDPSAFWPLRHLIRVMRRLDLTKKTQWQRQIQRQRQWQRQIHLENTFKERSQRLLTFETFDQNDEKIWSDQKKYNDKDNYKNNNNK